MTSKSAGRRTSSIAHESTSWWLDLDVREARRATSSTTVRHRRDVARTFALSTLGHAGRRRPRASSNAEPRRCARISRSAVGQRVERGARRRPAPRRLLGARRSRRRRSARGRSAGRRRRAARAGAATTPRGPDGRVTGRRLANSPSPPRSAKSACSGRTGAVGSDHFGPPTAPSRIASASPQAVDVLGPDRDAVRVDRGAADEELGPVDREAEALARRHRRRAGRRRRPPARPRRPGWSRSR